MKMMLRILAVLLAVSAAAQLVAAQSRGHIAGAPVLVTNGEPTG